MTTTEIKIGQVYNRLGTTKTVVIKNPNFEWQGKSYVVFEGISKTCEKDFFTKAYVLVDSKEKED